MTAPQPTAVRVANPSDGGLVYWLAKLYAFGAVALILALVGALPALYVAIGARTPPAPDLSTYFDRAALPSRMVAADGRHLTSLVEQRRELVPVGRVPAQLVHAFLASEDREFFEHGGIDLPGIARAAWTNLRAGRVRQGGSTITQQVAKAHLTSGRTIERKLKELVLARRIEGRNAKGQILQFYLNHIFLGSGAYGVLAASREYFDKNLDELTTAEMALLAGLAQAPSRYSPRAHPERARRRRDRVLQMMRKAGFIDEALCEAAQSDPLYIVPRRDNDPLPWVAPHFTEHIRRQLVSRFGKHRVYTGGWRIDTTVDPSLQRLARQHTHGGVRALDKRQGWRGPVARLRTPTQRREIIARLKQLYPTKTLEPNRPYLAVVTKVAGARAKARIGDRAVVVPLELMDWAARYSRTDPENNHTIDSARDALARGDLVWLVSPRSWRRKRDWGTVRDPEPIMALDQRPRVEGALLSFDHHSGYVLALVGGLDFDRSSFNRAVQACRQPGSTYKPIYYSLALDGDELSMGSVLQDKPYVPEPGEQWSPQNVHGTLDGEVSMHYALVKSLNLPSIQLLKAVGPQQVARWARRLGFTTKIIADKGLALGSSCVRMDELSRAFSIFARGGTRRELVYVRQIHDRAGQLIEDHTVAEDPLLAEDERLDRFWATATDRAPRVADRKTAFLMAKLLRDAVLRGIAARCRIVPVPTAGKGGTSSDTLDVWFTGFTSQWSTAVWIGDDANARPLGAKEASYTSAIPLWANYMKAAVGQRPHAEIPSFVAKGLRRATVDATNAGAPQPDRPTVEIFFKPGTFTAAAAKPAGEG